MLKFERADQCWWKLSSSSQFSIEISAQCEFAIEGLDDDEEEEPVSGTGEIKQW
jgi:hypothetical protein